MNFNKIIIFLSLVLSSYSIERRHHCSSITCGRDCTGDCGWSSFWNRCLQGYKTTRSEYNSGPGCTTPTTSQLTVLYDSIIPTTSATSTMTTTTTATTSTSATTSATSTMTTTTTATTSTSATSIFTTSTSATTSATTTITTKLVVFTNEQNSTSYTFLAGILVPLFFLIAILMIYRKKKSRRKSVVIMSRRQDYINKMYKEHTVYDEVYEDPTNSIPPYLVSQDFSSFYQEPTLEEEQYEEIGDENIYEYDDRMRALENEKYEG